MPERFFRTQGNANQKGASEVERKKADVMGNKLLCVKIAMLLGAKPNRSKTPPPCVRRKNPERKDNR